MSEIKIDLNSLNEKTNKVYRKYYKNESRVLCLYGGAGSGKSVFAAQKLLYRCLVERNHSFLVFRKVGATIKDSTFSLIKNVISQSGLMPYCKINITEKRFTFPAFNSQIHCAGLDEPEKLKSIAGVTGVWFEEATEFDEVDIEQAMLRVRGSDLKSYVQFILTLNPTDERHFLKAKFFDNPDKNTTILKTTYKDNSRLDKEYVAHLKSLEQKNENYYRIYALGEWGKENTGGNCYKQFKRSANVTPCEYDDALPACLTWDFNVLPYTTTLVAQVVDKTVKIFDEICLDYPHNRTRDNAYQFAKRYPKHTAGVTIFGDASGDQEDTKMLFGENNYTIIYEALRQYAPNTRVPIKNPPVKRRIEFIDSIFQSELYGIKIEISPKCKNLIEDLENIKENADGTKLKVRIKNKQTKQSYEQYGHATDALEYLICEYFATEFATFLQGGLLPEKPTYIPRQTSKYDY